MRRARGPYPPARLCNGLQGEPRGDGLPACPRTGRGQAAQRADAVLRRGRRRRDRPRAGRRSLDRSCVRPRAGRMQLLVQLLRDPARSRAIAKPQRRGGPARGSEEVEQGHREVEATGINLGCSATVRATRLRLVREAGATSGLKRLRLSSIEVNHVNEELVRALRETPTVSRHLHVPPSPVTTVCWCHGSPVHRRDLPSPAGAARGLQRDERRDRRLPGRGCGRSSGRGKSSPRRA